MDRRSLLLSGVAALSLPAVNATAADPTEVIKLWPDAPPGAPALPPILQITERSPDITAHNDRIAVNVAEPTLTVFRPRTPDGSAVLVIPGGSYRWVTIDKEGFETAAHLAEAGVTAFVLRYRSPGDGWRSGPDTPLQDAQRAVRLIRAYSFEYNIRTDRVGVLGFSAGGHVAALLATRAETQTYALLDKTDEQSAKPNFVGLIYPVITMRSPGAHSESRERLLGPAPTPDIVDAYSCERLVTADTPPTFIAAAADDEVVLPHANSLAMYQALVAARVPTEFHMFDQGGHGFGVRLAKGKPVAAWPGLFLHWGHAHGWFQSAASAP
jgi:acetyl esterase/lipase